MNSNFAIEQLESRLEQLCWPHLHSYWGTCYIYVLGIRIPYPCIKYYIHWHCL